MAQIIENQEGRRMIRLSPDDVLTVVSLYQQQVYGLEQQSYEGIRTRLQQGQIYLPEEV